MKLASLAKSITKELIERKVDVNDNHLAEEIYDEIRFRCNLAWHHTNTVIEMVERQLRKEVG